MFDWLVEIFTNYPYMGVAAIYLLAGLGFPLPEELVAISAGYICFKDLADPLPMMATCAASILAGDVIPFTLGRIFGSRLLRLRPFRLLITHQRLATFDTWFRRRGDLVIFFARFFPGLRIVAYFTAGTMKMRWRRFLTLDLLGILLVVPLFVWVGMEFGSIIDEVVEQMQKLERGLLITLIAAGIIVITTYWLRRRRRRKALLAEGPSETYVEPSPNSENKSSGALQAESSSEALGHEDAIAALIALGYSKKEARNKVLQAYKRDPGANTETLLRAILRD
ncbi:MAG: VTT domain-containing protein [Planctomycetota bacterium]|jgi:membrane protein DedA with SNARE-associated domain|nr:VTT domain-containing protein [Planctomycetota bacterium]